MAKKKRTVPLKKKRADAWREIQKAAAVMGIADEFGKLTRAQFLKKFVLTHLGSKVETRLRDDVEPTEDNLRLLAQMKRMTRSNYKMPPPLVKKVSVNDFFLYVRPFALSISGLAGSVARSDAGDDLRAYAIAEELISSNYMSQLLGQFWSWLLLLFMQESGVDTAHYWPGLVHGNNSRSQVAIAIELGYTRVPTRVFELPEGRRTTYRVGMPRWNGVNWPTWTGEQMGIGDPERSYEVYLTKHAAVQMNERLKLLVPWEGGLSVGLGLSVETPTFARNRAGDLFLEYRMLADHVGYLPVKIQEDAVVLPTLLFLTMDRTPVGEALYARLRLDRRDKSWLGLDRLETFLNEDLSEDTKTRAIMDTCGCGHLFDMIRGDSKERFASGLGEAVRDVVGDAWERAGAMAAALDLAGAQSALEQSEPES